MKGLAGCLEMVNIDYKNKKLAIKDIVSYMILPRPA
jgi:hypothetical protein